MREMRRRSQPIWNRHWLKPTSIRTLLRGSTERFSASRTAPTGSARFPGSPSRSTAWKRCPTPRHWSTSSRPNPEVLRGGYESVTEMECDDFAGGCKQRSERERLFLSTTLATYASRSRAGRLAGDTSQPGWGADDVEGDRR